MHEHVSLNNDVLIRTSARVAAVTGATLYGRGVFTTLAITRGAPFLWREHWARLIAHAERIGVDHTPLAAGDVRAKLDELVRRNNVTRGRARITLLARGTGGAWHTGDADHAETNVDLLIITGDPRPAPADGIALTVSPYRVNTLSPLTGLKTTNYLEQTIAHEEARARDFDEAVRLNERGEIASAALANIFWTTHGAIHTPALLCGALAGTTRGVVLELADELVLPAVEGVYQLADLADADEIFLTSSNLGVAFCQAYDFRRYTAPAGSIALRLREALRQRAFRHAEEIDHANTTGIDAEP